MKANKKLISVLGILWLGLSGLAFADLATDDAMRVAIESKLDQQEISNGGGPQVEVRNGIVTLRGKVQSLWAKRKAIELAMDVDGVDVVEDGLEIASGESDEAVAKAVARVVRRYPHFTIFDDVNVGIEGGNVLLTGRVTMPFKSEEIERRVSRVMGVQSLTNEITALPTNINDDRIRANLAYRIYSDDLFAGYASRVNPPIHIVVERGNVSLTGVVHSEVQKRKAEVIARQTFGVFDVENRLTVGD